MTDIERLERKLDLIIDALGLGQRQRLSPAQIDDEVQRNIILHFQKKENKKRGHGNEEGKRGNI